jgi:hypothetical protein
LAAGNVLPAVFRRMGVLKLGDSLVEALDAGKHGCHLLLPSLTMPCFV